MIRGDVSNAFDVFVFFFIVDAVINRPGYRRLPAVSVSSDQSWRA
jgi:hypothetical protein